MRTIARSSWAVATAAPSRLARPDPHRRRQQRSGAVTDLITLAAAHS